ncbi:MAG TPA: hypothetical protein VG273_04875 [Bryobacteraceae bacterium]|nr:hypothetical protein [Bryobacteraceae bacterium]
MIPGTAPRQMNIPFSSTWKVEDGKWCWYVDQSTLLDTPFGRARPKTDAAAENVANLKERISSGNLMDGVHADVTRLQLDPANPKLQTVTLKNTLPGPVSIQSITLSPGLKIAIAKPDLAADESTTVTVEPVAGEPDHPKQLLLRIGPLGQVIQIALEYPAAK